MEYIITTYWASGVTTTSVVPENNITKVMIQKFKLQKEERNVKTWMISPSSSEGESQ